MLSLKCVLAEYSSPLSDDSIKAVHMPDPNAGLIAIADMWQENGMDTAEHNVDT